MTDTPKSPEVAYIKAEGNLRSAMSGITKTLDSRISGTHTFADVDKLRQAKAFIEQAREVLG